ncbi:MAG: methylenetetrahydrofolate reductase [Candidatus Hermodarchaeota archaeon]
MFPKKKSNLNLSVEVEPPRIHSRILEQAEIFNFTDAIRQMAPFVELISVTNRPTFRMSSISTMKLILSVLRDTHQASCTFPVLHLTTRLSIHDTYNELLDARRLGIEYLLPVLGDPRGPKAVRFFNNSIDILAFIKGITDPQFYSSHSLHCQSITKSNADPIDDAIFEVGSIIDPNEYIITQNNKKIRIRENQMNLFEKRVLLGSDFFITQAIFDPFQALNFLDEIETKNKPIGIGIIPPTFTIANQIGVPLPREIVTQLKSRTSKKEQFQLALQIAHETYSTLRENGIKWIHVYSLGKPSVLFSITQEIPEGAVGVNNAQTQGIRD